MISWEYLAGFIDGEGSIKSYRSGGNTTFDGKKYSDTTKKLRPRVTIGQKEPEVLHEIQKFLGTSLKITESRGCYYLQICRLYDVLRIIEGVLPFLIVKKQDALNILDGVEKGI